MIHFYRRLLFCLERKTSMIFKGKLDKVIPPIGIFDRLLMQNGVTQNGDVINQRVIFMLDPGETAMLKGLAAGTELEIDAVSLGNPLDGIKATSVKVVRKL
jgi:hypothetical protein